MDVGAYMISARTFENQLLAHSVKLVLERTNYEVGSIGVGAGLYMYIVVVKSSRSLSHLLMSSCKLTGIKLTGVTAPFGDYAREN